LVTTKGYVYLEIRLLKWEHLRIDARDEAFKTVDCWKRNQVKLKA
jgi:hypothetical protein